MVGEKCYHGKIGSFLRSMLKLRSSPELQLGMVTPVIDFSLVYGDFYKDSSAGNVIRTVPVGKCWFVWSVSYFATAARTGLFLLVNSQPVGNGLDFALNQIREFVVHPFWMRARDTFSVNGGNAADVLYFHVVQFDL